MDMNTDTKSIQLIAGYAALLERSSVMLDRAREGEWKALIEEEAWYIAETERLAKLEAGLTLSYDMEALKVELQERILEQSLIIRHYLAKRYDMLGQMLDGSLGAGRQLERVADDPR